MTPTKLFFKKVTKELMGDKYWAKVYFNDEKFIWIPALIEQALIAQAVVECERIKYQYLENPEDMPKKFIIGAIDGEDVFDLSHEFKLTHTNAFKRIYFP